MDLFSLNTDVSELILRKNYGKAAKVLRARLEKEPVKSSLRQQLADVLILDGRKAEALPILESLADEYAVEGFVAKAIAVLKKIQRLDPAKVSVDEKLARLFKEKDDENVKVTALRRGGSLASGRFPAVTSSGINRTAPSAKPEGPQEDFVIEVGGREMLISPEPPKDIPKPLEPPRAFLPPPPRISDLKPGVSEPVAISGFESAESYESEDAPLELDASMAEMLVSSDGPGGVSGGIAKTPLFSDLNTEELVAVIKGLQLHTYEPGDIIVSEGEAGNSLYVVSTGTVKAFVKDASGRSHPIRIMQDGDFFGEMALLTGRPRTATITAATLCELLELDSDNVRQIAQSYPRVGNVLRAFCEIRMRNPAENLIRRQGA
jgi:hypothetical protein